MCETAKNQDNGIAGNGDSNQKLNSLSVLAGGKTQGLGDHSNNVREAVNDRLRRGEPRLDLKKREGLEVATSCSKVPLSQCVV